MTRAIIIMGALVLSHGLCLLLGGSIVANRIEADTAQIERLREGAESLDTMTWEFMDEYRERRDLAAEAQAHGREEGR